MPDAAAILWMPPTPPKGSQMMGRPQDKALTCSSTSGTILSINGSENLAGWSGCVLTGNGHPRSDLDLQHATNHFCGLVHVLGLAVHRDADLQHQGAPRL